MKTITLAALLALAATAANAEPNCTGDIKPVSCVFPTSHNGGSTGGSDGN